MLKSVRDKVHGRLTLGYVCTYIMLMHGYPKVVHGSPGLDAVHIVLEGPWRIDVVDMIDTRLVYIRNSRISYQHLSEDSDYPNVEKKKNGKKGEKKTSDLGLELY